MRARLCSQLLCTFLLVSAGEIWAANQAVVLLYHNVSDSTPAITSVTPEQFELHLDYLDSEGFSVLPLTTILDAVSSGKELPERSVAISFDDAYQSVYENAFPSLKSRAWPFSLFVSSDAVDFGYGSVMTWSNLAELAAYGVEIGGHSASHTHLVRFLAGESEDQWLNRIAEEIDRGNNRIEEELGTGVRLFAYPYGEHSEDIRELISERGLYGMAQQSGAVGPLTDYRQIPRFPMAQSYADMDRFSLVVKSRPLPVAEIEAGNLVRTVGDASGELTFTLLLGGYQMGQVACFSSAGQRLEIGRSGAIVRVSLPVFVPGRNKINCTAPSSSDQASEAGVFYWFSEQWIVKDENGDWLVE